MNFKSHIDSYEQQMVHDIKKLCSIPSIRDAASAKPGAPFGTEIRRAFDVFIEIASSLGFTVVDFDGYALHVTAGSPSEDIGILGHLDVVPVYLPELWKTNPFEPVVKDGYLFGRGVNDDKGPLVAALYAMKIISDNTGLLRRSIRLIAGGAEETTWECMDHYFLHNPQPKYGFSPDGNFPIVNGEKGILVYKTSCMECSSGEVLSIESSEKTGFLCSDLVVTFCDWTAQIKESAAHASLVEEQGGLLRIRYEGTRTFSRNPQKGTNALYLFAEDFKDYPFNQPELSVCVQILNDYFTNQYTGKAVGLYSVDSEMGETTFCPTGLEYQDGLLNFYFDYRFPKTVNIDIAKSVLEALFPKDWDLELLKEKDFLYVSPDTELIHSLQSAYQKVTGEPAGLFTKGAMSYARALTCGVAFGPTFEGEIPNTHMPNEKIAIASLKKAMEIYCEALYLLTS